MNLHLSGYISRPSNRQLLDDLRGTAKKLRATTLSHNQYKHSGNYSPTTITRRFGTWNNALLKARLSIKKHYNIPIPQLLQNLHRLWRVLGRQPYLSDLYPPLSRFGRRPYLRVFGSWSCALKTFVSSTNKTNGNTRNISLRPRILKRPASSKRYITWRLRHLVMKRDNFRCKACGASPALNPGITLHIDHIIPLRKGGQSTLQNLQTLCSTCNIGKSDL